MTDEQQAGLKRAAGVGASGGRPKTDRIALYFEAGVWLVFLIEGVAIGAILELCLKVHTAE